jgi:hypothetical protein
MHGKKIVHVPSTLLLPGAQRRHFQQNSCTARICHKPLSVGGMS